MTRTNSDDEGSRFYNVDKFREVLEFQRLQEPPGRLTKAVRHSKMVLDSGRGLVAAFAGIPLMFGGVFVVMVGVLYGPLVFLAVAGGYLGVLAFHVHRKVGKSLIFGENPLHREIVAQTAGFLLVAALLYLMINLTRLVAWIRGFF